MGSDHNMLHALARHLLVLFSLLLLAACDEDQVARAKGYVERLASGLLDQAGSSVSADRAPIRVHEFLPEPNYNASGPDAEAAQMTDGTLERPPLWVRDGGVGWFGQTPVVISAERQSGPEKQDGKIRLHAGLGRYAGTSLPRQIDVYSQAQGRANLVGSYREPPGLNPADKKSYWIEVPVKALSRQFSVAVHGNGAYIQIDELEFVPGEVARAHAAEAFDAPDLQAIRDDASAQLRLNFELRAGDRGESRARWREVIGTGQVSWVADAWDQDPGQWGPEVQMDAPEVLRFAGYNGEKEVASVGFFSTGMGFSELSVEVKGAPVGAVSLFQLARVMTADGRLVYDPLKPMDDGLFRLQSGWPELLWVEADLSKMPVGESQAELRIRGASLEKTYPLEFHVVDEAQLAPATLDAKVWSYSRDMPIWGDSGQAMRDLQEHYVNTWVVHPSDIPGVSLDGKPDPKAEARLLADLERYHGLGKVHLFLGWTGRDNPFGISPDQPEISSSDARDFTNWLQYIQGLMRSANYEATDWAFYPMDEISGEETRVFLSVSRLIREAVPDARIYANPISTTTQPTSVEQLRALEEVVDEWQPVSKLYHSEVGAYFDTTAVPQGFFHIPDVPAKAAAPIRDYRALGWHAWRRNAKSIGFWAYSDSTGSSVWDDFDGRRPDFAVVYEDAGRLISSRRWEGFAAGIEDYRLLKGSQFPAPKDLQPSSLTARAMQKLRQEALKTGQ